MSSYTIKSGDTLWNIVKQQYGLTSVADIQKKIKEVAETNKINDPGSIFTNQKLVLNNAKDSSVKTKTDVKDSQIDKIVTDPVKTDKTGTTPRATAAGTAGVIDNTRVSKDTDFNAWTTNVAFGKTTEDLDLMKGTDFQTPFDKGDFQKAKDIYKQKMLEVAENEIKLRDKDGDGKISFEEHYAFEKAELKKNNINLTTEEDKEAFDNSAMNSFVIMNLQNSAEEVKNNKKSVDKNELAAYFATIDMNNDIGGIDGKISVDELAKTSSNFEGNIKDNDSAIRSFRDNFLALFNNTFIG